MRYSYRPQGVCSRQMIFDIEGDVIENVQIIGGCPGNLLGISHLVKGQKIDDVIARLENVRCGGKPTSCPDQMAKALRQIREQ